MMKFLANSIEQLDLALEHILMGDANNARFGLMLVDNVVEITLHQIAKDAQSEMQSWMYRDKTYEHSASLQAALGQNFEPKVKFAKKTGKLDSDSCDTIGIFHSFRNEVYHIGVMHEAILPTISRFHFKIACDFLRGYSPLSIWFSPDMVIPARTEKYFSKSKHFLNGIEEYHSACEQLSNKLSIDSSELATVLASHLCDVIEEQDASIEMIATGGPRTITRNSAIKETMAWKIAFSAKSKEFAKEHGWSTGSVFDFVKWIEENYPIPIRKDPIAAWQKRAQRLRQEKNSHRALKKYRDFMTQTAEIRSVIEEAHMQVERYIDEQIDRMQGK